jgi:phage gp29-like protein
MLFTDMLNDLVSPTDRNVMTTQEFQEQSDDVPPELEGMIGSEGDPDIRTLVDQGVGFLHNVEVPGDNITHEDKMKMKKDPVIRFALLLKKFSILGMGYQVNAAVQNEDDERYEEAQEIRDFVSDNFRHEMNGSFINKLRRILSAIDHGVSVNEKVWTMKEDRVVLSDIKTREFNLHEFDFNKDRHGNLISVEQMGVSEDIPLEKLIIFSYLEEGQFLTGTSDLEVCWDSWFRKKNIKEFYSAFLELRSKINATAKFPGRDMESELAQSVWQMLKNLQLGGRMIIPENVETEIIEMTKSDANAFFKAIKYFDSQIMRAALLPQLIGEASTAQANVGSFALGEKHFNIFVLSLRYIKEQLEYTINNEVVRDIVDYNFDTELYPTFQLNMLREDTPQARSEILQTLIEMGVVDSDEDWIRDYVGIPSRGDVTVDDSNPSDVAEMKQELNELQEQMQIGDQLS